MQKPSTIAYGRICPDAQVQIVGRRHQINSIKNVGGFSKIDIEFDVASGGSFLKNRPALMQQLHEAHRHGVSLCVESMDRIVTTYDRKRIRRLRKALGEFGVQIAVANINHSLLRRIRRIVSGSKSESQKRKALVQRIDQYLRWRHSSIFPGVASAQEIALVLYRELKNTLIFPVLELCAEHLLELDTKSREFDWCVHSFLGSAFSARNELLHNHNGSADSENLSYGKRPQDAELFKKIHELENRRLKTADGRPKCMSSQRIADELNRRGFCNLRGTPFSRKTIFQIRRGAAYLGSGLGRTVTTPTP